MDNNKNNADAAEGRRIMNAIAAHLEIDTYSLKMAIIKLTNAEKRGGK